MPVYVCKSEMHVCKNSNILITIWLIRIGLDVRLDRYALGIRIQMIVWLFLPGFLYDVKKH